MSRMPLSVFCRNMDFRDGIRWAMHRRLRQALPGREPLFRGIGIDIRAAVFSDVPRVQF